MASITIPALTLALAADLTNLRSFPTLSKLAPSPTVNGETREYAGGRYRDINTPGKQVTLAVTVTGATRADVQWLELNMRALMLVRDSSGRKFYGSYRTLSITEYPATLGVVDVDWQFAEITYSEAV